MRTKFSFQILSVVCLLLVSTNSSLFAFATYSDLDANHKDAFKATTSIEPSSTNPNLVCDMDISSTTTTDESCTPGSDGSIIVTATCPGCTGGNASIRYSINGGTLQVSNSFSSLTAGTYTVRTEDVGDPTCFVEVDVVVNNTPTTIMDDQFSTNEDATVSLTVLDNDLNTCGNDRTLLIVSNGSLGSGTLAGGNTISYTPNNNIAGCDTIEYAFFDPPIPTTANDDITSTDVGIPVNVSVLNNDTDPQNDPLSASLVGGSGPSNGIVSFSGGIATYTPNAGFAGLDQFTYEINDGNGNTDQAQVRINVRSGEQGKLHYLAPKWNGSNHASFPTSLWLSTESTDTANVTVTSLDHGTFTQEVPPNSTIQVQLSPAVNQFVDTFANTTMNNRIMGSGLKITSDVGINAQLIQAGGNINGQSFLNSKSVNGLGTEFYAGQGLKGANNFEGDGRSMISVMATEDNTTVTFTTPPGSSWNWADTTVSTITVVLNENESYMVSSTIFANNILGAKVVSDKPISVSSGAFGLTPVTDNGWDQLVPVERVGTDYILIAAPSNPDQAFIVATEDDTEIFINNVLIDTIDNGKFYLYNMLADSTNTINIVTTSKPTYVFRDAGVNTNAENGMALIAPVDVNGRGLYRFRTPFVNGTTVPVSILTSTSAISTLVLTNLTDNTTIPITDVRSIPSRPELSLLILNLDRTKEFKVESNSFVQILMLFGSNLGGGLSYIAGFASSGFTSSDDAFTVVQDIPATFSPLGNDTDSEGNPINIVNFTQPSNGTVVDNGNGTFTYTPDTGFAGQDTFTYTISNGQGFFSTASVYINVEALSTGITEVLIAPVADNPGITTSNVSGDAGTSINVPITVGSLVDTDGSESINDVVISGVPSSISFSAGTNNNDGTWTMTLAQLTGLTATGSVGGTFNLVASVNVTDASIDCSGSAVSDNEGFGSPFSMTVNVTCDIVIDSVATTNETCPDGNDGTITVSASCTSCGSIEYSVGQNIWQSSNVFTGLFDSVYTVFVRDSLDNSCSDLSGGHEIFPGGPDTTPPSITAPADITVEVNNGCEATGVALGTATVSDNCSATANISVSNNVFSLATAEFNGTFGSLSGCDVRDLQNPVANYSYGMDLVACTLMCTPTDNCHPLNPTGAYLVANNESANQANQTVGLWDFFGHTTGLADDAFLIVNGGTSVGVFYNEVLTLNSNVTYEYGFWASGAESIPTANAPTIRARVVRVNDGTPIDSVTSTVLDAQGWLNFTSSFTPTEAGDYRFELFNISTQGGGNDFAIDDISFTVQNNNFVTGTTTVTWSATDEAGNMSSDLQTVTVVSADINVQGNGQDIVNGDATPDLADDTDYGSQSSGSSTTRTFTIQNTGTDTLSFTNNPVVMISGNSEFTLSSNPTVTEIPTGGTSITFDVTYAPTAAGTHAAVLTIGSNDCDEGSFSFAVAGAVVCDIAVTGVTTTNEICPDGNDGTITVAATCSTCSSIEYSVGQNIWQSSNVFTGLFDSIYTVFVRDSSDNSCSALSGGHEIFPGVDTIKPTIECNDISVTLNASGTYTLSSSDLSALAAGSSDSCSAFGDLTIAATPSSFDCNDVVGQANNLALAFDESTAGNGADYVVSTNNVGISGSQPRTLEFWVRMNETNVFNEHMVNWGASTQGKAFGFYQTNNSELEFYTHDSPNGWDYGTGHFFDEQQWYHVAGTYDGVDSVFVFINGQPAPVPSYKLPGVLNTTDSPLFLAVREDLLSITHSTIDLDEVRIWNYRRTQAEIMADMNVALNGNEPGLVLYYDMENNGPGTTQIIDKTANNNHGTLTNMDPANDWIPSGSPVFSGGVPIVFEVTDEAGNTATSTCAVTVSVNSNISIASIATGESCDGNNDGSLALTVTGGTGPYTFIITRQGDGTSDTIVGFSSETFVGLNPDDYIIEVTENGGCTASTTDYVASSSTPCCDIAVTGVTTTNETCPDGNDGTITVSASCTSCGSIEYSVGQNVWQSSNVFTGLSDGTYTIYARDSLDFSCNDSNGGNIINPGGPDTTPPSITAPGDITVEVNNGCEADNIDFGMPTVSDNCTASGLITTTTSVTSLAQSEFNGTFGTLAGCMQRDLQAAVVNYTYGNTCTPTCPGGLDIGGCNTLQAEGRYAVVNQSTGQDAHDTGNLWNYPGHTTGTPDDAFLAVNGSTTVGIFYSEVLNINSGVSFDMSFWAAGANPTSVADAAQIRARLVEVSTNTRVATITSTPLITTTWTKFDTSLVVTQGGDYRFEILNTTTQANGNDFAIDDISFVVQSNNFVTGTTTVTWTATDASGNSATDVQNVTVVSTDINVQGNGQDITNGDMTPDVADDTDFGNQSVFTGTTRTFTIENLGTDTLEFTNNPVASITGSGDFIFTSNPTVSEIPTGGTAITFDVLYFPIAAGTDTATITIGSNDCDEGSFSFAVSGAVVCDIEITGVTPTDEVCPDAEDGTLTATASCTTCSTIEYSTDSTTWQSSNVFTGLPDGTYTVYVRDTSDYSCNDSFGGIVINPGSDTTPPNAICPSPLTVYLDGSGDGIIVANSLGDGSSTDNCTTPTETNAEVILDCDDLAGINVELIATDGAGLSDTIVCTVSVLDTIPPTAICPFMNVNVALDSLGQGTLLANALAGESTDNCSVSSELVVATNYTCADVGNNTVLLTVTDGSGLTDTISCVVEVIDTIAPIVACNDIFVYLDANGDGFFTGADVDNGSTDNCTVSDSFTYNIDTVFYNCNDVNIQTGCGEFALDFDGVNDYVVTDNNIQHGVNFTYEAWVNVQSTVSSNFQGILTTFTGTQNNNLAQLAINASGQVVAEIKGDLANDERKIRTSIATIVGGWHHLAMTFDGTDLLIYIDGVVQATLPSGGAPDSFDDDVINNYSVNRPVQLGAERRRQVGFFTDLIIDEARVWSITRSQADIQSTMLNCLPSGNMPGLVVYFPLEEGPGSLFVDNVAGTPDASLMNMDETTDWVGGSPQLITGGVVDVLKVFDQSGNSDSCSFNVVIADTIAPLVACDDITIQLDGSGNASIVASDVENSSSDACGIANSMIDIDTFTCNNIGSNQVNLMVTDNNGNTNECISNVTVQDTIPPVAVCQNIIVQLDSNGVASIVAADVDNGSNDNCGAVTYSIDTASFNCTDLGTNNVLLIATDGSNNMDTCTAIVTVEDNIAPEAICVNGFVAALDANGMVSIIPADLDNNSTDNCTVSVDSLSMSDFTCAHLGNNTVTLYVSDQSDNTDDCSTIVEIVDNTAPTVVCNNTTVYLDASGSATIDVDSIDGGSTDNCGIASRSLSASVMSCDSIGDKTVWLYIQDQTGNIDSCASTVSVLDTIPPMAVCQPFTVQLNASGAAVITGADVDGGSSDNCGNLSLSTNPSTFDCTQLGPNNVLLTVTAGTLTDTCTALVTVEDNIAPTAVCEDITIHLDGNGMSTITANDVDGGSTDNCTGFSTSVDSTSFDCSELGDNTVEFIITDGSNNMDTCYAIVTVVDTLAPMAICQDITVYVDGNGQASITASDVSAGSDDNCDGEILSVDQSTFDCDDINASGSASQYSLSFGGGAQGLLLPNSPSILFDNNEQVTIEMWVKTTATDLPFLFSNMNCNGTDSFIAIFLQADGNVTFRLAESGNQKLITTTGQTLNDGNWRHVACVFDPLNDLGSIYIDGSLIISDVVTQNHVSAGTPETWLGRRFLCPGTNSLDGELDEVRIWSAARTSSEIANNMNNTLTGSEAGLIAYYDFEDGPGSNVATDKSPNGNNGNLNNMDVNSSWLTDTPPALTMAGVPVTLTVTDNAGNQDSCIALVTVLDTIPPTAICQDLTVALDSNGIAKIIRSAIDNGSTDNCNSVFLPVDSLNFDCASLGGNTVSMTISDASGNLDSCSATVTVNDLIAPEAQCANIIIALDASGMRSILPEDVDNGSSDNCTVTIDSLSKMNFACANLGQNFVTLYVSDQSNNVSSCSAEVTVIDNTPPTVVCNDITVYLDGAGEAILSVDSIDGGSTDNCSIVERSLSVDTLTCANISATSVWLYATDQSNNVDSCAANVTVIDTIPPVAICQDVTVSLDANGSASITAAEVDNGSSDNCSAVVLAIDSTSFDCLELGGNSVQLIVGDGSGNVDSCMATVTVTDTLSPTAICQDITIYLDGSGTASIAAGDIDGGSTDNCNGVSVSVDNASFTCGNLGTNTVQLTVTDASNNLDSCMATVTVLDTIPPVAVCQDVTVYLDGNGEGSLTASEIDNGSTDNCAVSTSGIIGSPAGLAFDQNVTSDVIFGAGNANGSFTIGTGGEVELGLRAKVRFPSPSNTFNSNADGSYNHLAGSFGGDGMQSGWNFEWSVNSNATGAGVNLDQLTYELGLDFDPTDGVDYLVFDPINQPFADHAIGNNSTTNGGGTSAVDAATYAALIANNNLAQNSWRHNFFGVFDGNVNGRYDVYLKAYDLGGNEVASTAITVVAGAGTGNLYAGSIIPLSVQTYDCSDLGTLNETLMVFDQSSNSDNCSSNVTVLDTIPPVALCQDITIYLGGSGEATITAGDVDGGSSDNCAITSMTVDSTSFDCGETGINVVMLSIVDASGNTDTCAANVTVLDTVPPVAVCQDITIYLDGSGDASISAGDVDGGSSDNCTIISMSIDSASFNCNNIGANSVQLIVGDASNNLDSCTANVTVLDTVPPMAICQDVTIYLDNDGEAAIVAADIDGGSSDNCGTSALDISQSEFDCGHLGANAVTFTITDGSSNLDSCLANVMVLDSIAPVVMCDSLTVYLDENGIGNIEVPSGGGVGAGDANTIYAIYPFNAGINADLLKFDYNTATDVITLVDAQVDTISSNRIQSFEQHPSNGLHYLTIDEPSGRVLYSYDVNTLTLSSPIGQVIEAGGAGKPGAIAFNENGILYGVYNSGNIDIININDGTTVNFTTIPNFAASIGMTYDYDQDRLIVTYGQAPIRMVAVDLLGNVTQLPDLSASNANADGCTISAQGMEYVGNGKILASSMWGCEVIFTIDIATGIVNEILSEYSFPTNVDVDRLKALSFGSPVAGPISDNCTIDTAYYDNSIFTCSDLLGDTVTLTAVDQSGNMSSCQSIVTVLDTIAPDAVCNDLTIYLDTTGSASITAADVDGGSTDNCAIVSTSIDSTSFDCGELGANTVILTVVDTSGNSSMCNSTVTVLDTISPEALCQDITIYLDNNGAASIIAANVDGGSSDNCGVTTMNIDSTSFDCGELGANTVLLTIADASSNTDTCSAVVTVLDTIPPVAVCQDITIYLDGSGTASITAGDVDGGSSDNCAITSMTVDSSSFDCSEAGTNVVTLTVGDVSNNSSSCTSNVTVLDTIAPMAVCQDVTIYLDTLGQALITAGDVDGGSSDNCGLTSITVDSTMFDCGEVGGNTVILTVGDGVKTDTCTATVTVLDTIAPFSMKELVGGNGGNLNSSAAYVRGNSAPWGQITNENAMDSVFGVGAWDDLRLATVDPNVLFSSNYSFIYLEGSDQTANELEAFLANYGIQLEAWVSSGGQLLLNAAPNVGDGMSYGFGGVILDYVGANVINVTTDVPTHPIFDGPQLPISTTYSGGAFGHAIICPPTLNGVVLLRETGTNNRDVLVEASFGSGKVLFGGMTTTNFHFPQPAADNLRANIISYLANPTTPRICIDTTIALDANGLASITAAELDNMTTDNCGIASIVIDSSSFDCAELGDNMVTFTATDVNNNVSTCISTVTVIDTIAPVAMCPATNVALYLNENGSVVLPADSLAGLSTDNCSVTDTSFMITFDCNNLGNNDVYVIATDQSGNVDSTICTVEVYDTIAPQAICPTMPMVYLDSNGEATISNTMLIGNSTDNCTVASEFNDPMSYHCGDLGSNFVRLVVIDQSGNTDSTMCEVMVVDTIPPTITCADPAHIFGVPALCEADSASIAQILGQPVNTDDNCTVDTTYNDLSGIYSVGMHTITWTTVDQSGNSTECSQILCVNKPQEIPGNGIDEDCDGDLDEVPTFVLVPLSSDTIGTCISNTDCCTDTYCYGLEYTPDYTGTLANYTTAFLVNCTSAGNPVIYNSSCVMTDNSLEISDCANSGESFFNASGANGSIQVTEGQSLILHQICFNVPANEVITIVADSTTELTTSIDLPKNGPTVTEYPEYNDIMVFGNTPPAITAVSIGICYPDAASAIADALAATTATDDCSDTITFNAIALGTCETTVRVYATDHCGLVDSIDFGVTIDGDVPVIVGVLDTMVVQGCDSLDAPNALFDVDEIEALTGNLDIQDACTVDSLLDVSVVQSVSGMCPIEIVRTYTVTDQCGYSSTFDHVIHIEDNHGPIIWGSLDNANVEGCSVADIPAPVTSVAAMEALPGQNFGVNDLCNDSLLTVTSEDFINVDCTISVTRIYTITDVCGNFSTTIHRLFITDTTPPVMTAGQVNTCYDSLQNAVDAAIAATTFTDNCATELAYTYTIIGSCPSTVNIIGADFCGNTDTVSYIIQINGNGPTEVGGPVSISDTIQTVLDTQLVAPPVFEDACGNLLVPVGPTIGGTYQDGDCSGTITYSYDFTDCAGTVTTWTYTYYIDCGQVNIKVCLEGAFDTNAGSMTTALNDNHVLPGQDHTLSPNLAVQLFATPTPFGQPYQGLPYNYTGNLGDTYGDASATGAPVNVTPYPPHVVDWVLVSVRENGIGSSSNVWQCAGWVHTNGDVTFPDACPTMNLDSTSAYYIVVEHRNHLAALDTADLAIDGSHIGIDFTSSDSYAPIFRKGQKDLGNGKYGLFSGNSEQRWGRGAINSADRTIWRQNQNKFGYYFGDFNLNVITNSADETIWKNNQNTTTGIQF